MGEAFNWEGTLHAGNAVLDRLMLEGLSEKVAWVEPVSELLNLWYIWDKSPRRGIPWIWERFYLRLIFRLCKMESISDLPDTRAGKRGKAGAPGWHRG